MGEKRQFAAFDDLPKTGSRTARPSRGSSSSSFARGPKSAVEAYGGGAPFVSIPKFRNKKSFPFLTPQQAVKKYLFEFHEEEVTPIAPETLRIIPFGGVEQVGLNCVGFEYGEELLIVDMGIQFSDPYQHGINGTVPDLTYARGKKVVGICITHGHIDHIGGMPAAAEQLGRNVPVWATPMAYELIALRQGENNAHLTNMHEYRRNETITISKYFQVTPFTVDHSIPDSVGLMIQTPVGRFIHTGDWKFDKNPLPYRPSTDYNLLESFGDQGIRALLSDSTNAHLSGSSVSESEIVRSMEDIFVDAKGRVITATFSSIIDRVALIIATAEKYNRKVVLMGRSMNNYLEIAFKLGYTRPKPGTIISMEQANRLPDHEVCICCTGAQGERYAAMMRMATGEHKDTTLRATDTVVFSSSVIPGNERAVQLIFDIIMAQGPTIKHYRESEIHAGGHARQEDTEKMIKLIRPEVYVPIYGYPHMLHGNAKNAYKL
jgi:ribonuclease J